MINPVKLSPDPAIPRVRLTEVTPYLRQMQTRMPFRFGKTVMTGMPVVYLKVRLETGQGRSLVGWSACGLVSMWFDKDYEKSEARREADLLYSVHEAISVYKIAQPASAWDLHRDSEAAIRESLSEAGLNSLTAGYGLALLDSAIIDGICRGHDLPFHKALRQNLLGFDPQLSQMLPQSPTDQMGLRHTIGLGDPLVAADLSKPLNDGLPETLEQVILQYGARYFKIKVNNNIPESIDRLRRIASILDEKVPEYAATLDGNEAFPTMDEFYDFLTQCTAEPALKTLLERTLWIEQPVARQQALDPGVNPVLKAISAIKPIIIDESDGDDAALGEALKLGYAGISAKNCKGVFRTLQSFQTLHAPGAANGLILSSEDLTNQPIVPNHQDLAVAAALGITHSERNGHHFFRGFEFLSPSERQQALEDYPKLYENSSDGIPSLRFHNGMMSLTELNNSNGLGIKSEPDWASMRSLVLPDRPPQQSM